MLYRVLETTMETVTIWDRQTMDKNRKAIPIDLTVGAPHPFRKGQEVSVRVVLETDIPLTDEDLNDRR